MSLSIEKERQVCNAVLAARAGSPTGLTTGLEQRIYALLTAEGGVSGGAEGPAFSLDEQVCGTWVDGRPIYRKIFTDVAYKATGAFSNGNIDLTALNIDTVIMIEGMREAVDKGGFYPMSGNAYAYVVGNTLQSRAESGVSALTVGTYVWIALYYLKRDEAAGRPAAA